MSSFPSPLNLNQNHTSAKYFTLLSSSVLCVQLYCKAYMSGGVALTRLPYLSSMEKLHAVHLFVSTMPIISEISLYHYAL